MGTVEILAVIAVIVVIVVAYIYRKKNWVKALITAIAYKLTVTMTSSTGEEKLEELIKRFRDKIQSSNMSRFTKKLISMTFTDKAIEKVVDSIMDEIREIGHAHFNSVAIGVINGATVAIDEFSKEAISNELFLDYDKTSNQQILEIKEKALSGYSNLQALLENDPDGFRQSVKAEIGLKW